MKFNKRTEKENNEKRKKKEKRKKEEKREKRKKDNACKLFFFIKSTVHEQENEQPMNQYTKKRGNRNSYGIL